ncbi:hypothetical protein KAI92_05225 [Candidatus Parcubacteria bacterium]|nr:hypothetical protein [Candidatus Parcubacteria bacterium]
MTNLENKLNLDTKYLNSEARKFTESKKNKDAIDDALENSSCIKESKTKGYRDQIIGTVSEAVDQENANELVKALQETQINELGENDLTRLQGEISTTIDCFNHWKENLETQKPGVVMKFVKKDIPQKIDNINRQIETLTNFKQKIRSILNQIENQRMGGLASDFETAIVRNESILIVGLSDETVINFLEKKGLKDEYEVINFDEFMSTDNKTLMSKKLLIITGVNDLNDKTLKQKLWILRGEKEMDNSKQVIVISKQGKEEDTIGAYQGNPFYGGTTNLFTNIKE